MVGEREPPAGIGQESCDFLFSLNDSREFWRIQFVARHLKSNCREHDYLPARLAVRSRRSRRSIGSRLDSGRSGRVRRSTPDCSSTFNAWLISAAIRTYLAPG